MALVCAVLLYQFWLFAQVVWYNYRDPGSSAMMREELSRLRKEDPGIELKYEWVPYDKINRSLKRAVPEMAAERSDGRSGAGSALLIAAWIDYVTAGNDFQDPLTADIQAAVALDGTNRVQGLLRLVSAALAEDPDVVALVSRLLGSFEAAPAATPART